MGEALFGGTKGWSDGVRPGVCLQLLIVLIPGGPAQLQKGTSFFFFGSALLCFKSVPLPPLSPFRFLPWAIRCKMKPDPLQEESKGTEVAFQGHG